MTSRAWSTRLSDDRLLALVPGLQSLTPLASGETWNYAVVHAHGTPRAIDDGEWLRQHVTALTSEHEAPRERPWAVSDAPASFIDAMLRGIVGIEIPIITLEGKWKVSQNRSVADRLGVVAGLTEAGGEESREMASLVAEQTGGGANRS